jgi:hypothetical protein
MKRTLLTLAAAAACLAAVASLRVARAQDKKAEQDKGSLWMKKKLELSQNILAGLAAGDFEMIRENAQSMNILNYLEKWSRADMADYKRQVSHFEFANKELMRQARDKNLEGATLAFNQLTASCVQCHKIVRDSK